MARVATSADTLDLLGLPTGLKSPEPCLDISAHCFSVLGRLKSSSYTPDWEQSGGEGMIINVAQQCGIPIRQVCQQNAEVNNQDKLEARLRFALLALCSRFCEGGSSCIQFL